MASLVTEIQSALRSRLLSSTELRALVGDRIYDQPPIDVAMPFIRFMGLEYFQDDTDGGTGLDLKYGLVVESRPGNPWRPLNLRGALRRLR